jgi:hypothetical protein
MVGAAFAWQFYGDVHGTHMVDAGKVPSIFVNAKSTSSKVIPVELDPKISDRVPTQDQAAPVLMVSATPGSSPELQHQLETIASDVAVMRRIVERLAAVQEQMASDVATRQKAGQTASQKALLLPHSPAAPVPSRKYAPVVVRSNGVAHSPFVPRTYHFRSNTIGAPLKSQKDFS